GEAGGDDGRAPGDEPPSTTGPEAGEAAGQAAADGSHGARAARARGRFTRNFVVQGSAADWAVLMLAGLRQRLMSQDLAAELVFFQHDEVIVHCPAAEAEAVREAIDAAGR
ncbi:DNA polymerase, partial [Streptomyces albus]